MELMICGSAAAEGWPALFCNCRCCLAAREKGGKDLRTRTAYQLGDEIRIDFGPDSLAQMLRFGLPFERLKHVLLTHAHEDHWTPHELSYRRPGFSVVDEDNILTVHGNARVLETLQNEIGEDLARYRLATHEVRPGEAIPLGNGIRATPLLASHNPAEACMLYVFEVGDKAFFIANDSGWFAEGTWEMLRRFKLDFAIVDCTNGKIDGYEGHMGCKWVVNVRDRLLQDGILKPRHRVIANHFSHNGGWIHEELEAFFKPQGIEVGYDGMRIQI